MSLQQALQELRRRIETSAPSRDPRRTDACPSFTMLAELAQTSGSQSEHIASCPYCQAVLAAVQRQQPAPVTVQRPPLVPVIVPDNTAPVTNITPHLREYAARWFQRNQPAEDAELAGVFDEEGTLHLSLSDLTLSGPARVRLVADEMPLPLIDTEVTGDHWEAAIALPDWNLRNVRIAREWVELVAA